MKSVHLSAYKALQLRLIEAREAAGLTQTALAALLGKHQSYVSKIESGDRRLDVVEYAEWMRALGLPPGALIEELAFDLERSRSRRVLVKR